MKPKLIIPILIALAASVPGTLLKLAGAQPEAPVAALVSGGAILGASFLLLWACDAAQTDISQALALSVVALIAVLPEYAVDMYFTWQAGLDPASDYARYTVANMTGANRLLIGVAWGAIVAVNWMRFRRDVTIEPERRTELFFLGLATVYAFVIPMKGALDWYDGVVFLGLYGWYMTLAARRPCEEPEADGPAELLIRLPKTQRRLATALTFLFAAGVILANAEPFCEGLVGTGKLLHVNEFLLVQWLAPIASEAPEFTVALMFAWRGQAGMALGSLLAAKLNQWTLLVGMIPGVYGVAHGGFDHPLPMADFQMFEILLTAAQSLLGVVLLASLRLSLGGVVLLFGLFVGQLALPLAVTMLPRLTMGLSAQQIHPVFSMLYVTVALAMVLQRPKPVKELARGLKLEAPCEQLPEPPLRTPQCARCEWRLRALSAGD